MRQESQAYGLHPQALELPKALAAITGGLKARQLDALSRLPEFAGILPSYDQLLQHGLWVSDSDGKDELPALQPDILAACLLSQVLARSDDKPGQWQYDTLAIADNPADASSRLGRLIHDATITLKLSWPMDELVEAVKNDAARCRMLDQGLIRPALERPLLPLAIAVSESLAKHAEDPAEQARHFNNLSVRLAESGDRAGGLEAIRRAVEIYGGLAEENFAAYGPDLAGSLNNLSVRLAESGDRAGGLEAIRRAVEIYERLAEGNFAAYGPDLAGSLNNLSRHLAESGDRVAGLEAIRRSVEIYEQLAEGNFAAYGPDLAMSLNNLSRHLAESGDRVAGLEAIRRAVEIYERLAEGNFAAYGPDLAGSLNNLSLRLAESGERAAGLEAIRRSVEIYEQLAEGNFAAYGPDLAMSLSCRVKSRSLGSERRS
jgi:hypothetical protein